MKKSFAILTVALFLGMVASPAVAQDNKQKPKTECKADTAKCKKADKQAKDCPKAAAAEKPACCKAAKK